MTFPLDISTGKEINYITEFEKRITSNNIKPVGSRPALENMHKKTNFASY